MFGANRAKYDECLSLLAQNISDCLRYSPNHGNIIVVREGGVAALRQYLPDGFPIGLIVEEWGVSQWVAYMQAIIEARPFKKPQLPFGYARNGLDPEDTLDVLVVSIGIAMYNHKHCSLCEDRKCRFLKCRQGNSTVNDCVVAEVGHKFIGLMSGFGAKNVYKKLMPIMLDEHVNEASDRKSVV